MLPGTTFGPTEVLSIARRHWKKSVILPAVGLFSALLYSSTLPDAYQSDMLIAIDPQRVPDAFVRSTVTLEAERRVDAIAVQVLSRTVLLDMVQRFELYPELRGILPVEDVVTKMREAIEVQVERPRAGRSASEPTAFHVRFTYSDATVAAKVTQQLGNLFVQQNTTDRSAQADATNRFLEDQLEEARSRLEEHESRLEQFRRQHGPELPTQMPTNLQAIQSKQMQVQALVESSARDRDRKLMLERLYREALNDPPARIPARPSDQAGAGVGGTETAAQRLESARASLAALEQKYLPEHPDVLRARRLVAQLEDLAASERDTAARSGNGLPSPEPESFDPVRREQLRQMRVELESLDRQVAFKEEEERRLRGEISEYQRRVEAVPGLESQWAAITRDYETQRRAYDELLTKSNAAQVSKDLESQQIGETFRVVDAAQVPVHPLSSQRLMYNAGGLALGLLLALALIAFIELRDAAFRTETEIVELLGLPVLAAVPLVATAAERKRQRTYTLILGTVASVGTMIALYLTWSLRLWKSLT
jgi:protein tyrosine kinase modulator